MWCLLKIFLVALLSKKGLASLASRERPSTIYKMFFAIQGPNKKGFLLVVFALKKASGTSSLYFESKDKQYHFIC